MSSKKALLGTSILAGVLTLAAMPAFAQTAPEPQEEATQVEEIVVTGSRLRRESLDTPTPVKTVGEEEFVQTAAGNAIDVIEDIPLVGAGSNSRGANTQFGDNFAFADLFNLGTQRTLTLVNGRRFISGNQATVFVPDNATGAQVDISVLPPSLIQSVEVTPLTGGAIYGADAVGGVINFILKDDFEGIEAVAQYGVTDYGDGERYRAGITWGTNFYEDRANITLAYDYFQQDLITIGGDRDFYFVGAQTNPFNGFTRNDTLTGNQLADTLRAGGALPSAFRSGAADRQPGTIFTATNAFNNNGTFGGTLGTGFALPTGVGGASFFIPNGFLSPALVSPAPGNPAYTQSGVNVRGQISFFAPTALPTGVTGQQVIAQYAPGTNITGLNQAQINQLGLNILQRARPTPQEYFAANPNLNPNLFLGSFFATQTGTTTSPFGAFPTIINPDVATRDLFPRLAVPLQFDNSGALVPFNYGDPALATFGTGIGGDGSSNTARGYGNLQSETERQSLAILGRLDITPSITYRGEALYTDISYRSVGGTDANTYTGSTTAGSRAIPVYIDQNPFFSAANRAQINSLAAQGLTVPTIGGQRVLFVNRFLADLTDGGYRSGNDVEMFRTAHSLDGEFGLWGRRFYWDASYVYGQNSIENIGQNLLDTEFALAVDVVQGPNGPVCRQQTLAAPESIAIRNPGLANINTTLGLVPTAAQVAACVPFSPFGENNATVTQQLRDYVRADTGSFNEARQHYLAASLGGEIFRLPGGWISAGAQIEWRNESLDFRPGADFATGAARNTTGAFSNGELRFLEYGYEAVIPIFGEDFTLPLVQALELSGAFRIVDRDQETQTAGFAAAPGVTDEVYQASLRWRLTDDLVLRANKSTSVRSASIIELYGAPGTGFTNPGGGGIPCTPAAINAAPDPAVRRANCRQAVILTGAATNQTDAQTFLDNYVGVGGARPAATAGNPFLNNEESEAIGYGFTFTPRWIPRLTIAFDYYDAEITGQVGLTGPPTTVNACFDQPTFPNSQLSGTPACDQFIFGVRDPATGNFVIPTVNPLTGTPVAPVAQPGSPATVNQPFQSAFFFFPNFNLSTTLLRAATTEVRYNFGLDELFGERASNWGDIFLSVSAYNLLQYDTIAGSVNPNAGEGGFADWEFRTDITHRVGRLNHRLTWNHTSETVGNALTSPADYIEQTAGFEFPSVDLFNYTIGYELRDNVDVRLTINNLLNTQVVIDDIGLGGVADAVGRTYLFTINGRF
jgi:outer membrane receptor protein involved in Fe transport